MKLRHKAELKALGESGGKKAKGSAKEMKQKEEELKKKHEEELKALSNKGNAEAAPTPEAKPTEGKDDEENGEGEGEGAAKQPEAKVAGAPTESRAARKKKTKAAKEKEREAQVAAEIANMKNPRKEEKEALAQQLNSLGMTVVEIRADGHCLYSSVADQLVLTSHPVAKEFSSSKKEEAKKKEPAAVVREIAAKYMLAHPADFIGFVTNDEGEPVLNDAEYQQYCNNITSPDLVIWGGEPEIVALSKALKCPIAVHSANNPPLKIGGDIAATPLNISLHRFELSAGNHYNSVVPVKH